MSGDLVLNRAKDSNIMFAATADINGNGCKEIIGNIGNGSDGYYNIIRMLPDTETITIPTKIQWKDIEVPVTVLSFTRCGDNVKDIYFNDLLPTSFNGKNVTVHASDSQIDKILSEFSVKAVITDNNKALSRDFFEYNLPWDNSNVTPKILFDVDGDGRLDLLSLTGRRTSENQARAIILGKSIDGKISYMSPSTQATPYNILKQRSFTQ
jgi:hypothetical protein